MAGFKEACLPFCRDYETIRALDHVSFAIEGGEMVGYINPNGAGQNSPRQEMASLGQKQNSLS